MLFASLHLSAQTDSLKVSSATTVDKVITGTDTKYHSPHKATLYSAVLPGLGQAYNKKYWKIPIVYAALGSVVYGISFNTKYYNIYKTAYRDLIIQDPANTSYMDIAKKVNLSQEDALGDDYEWFKTALENQKKYYKRNRDLCYFGFVAVYVLNMIDASVDAHFFNYDISNELSLELVPQINPGVRFQSGEPQLGMRVNLKF